MTIVELVAEALLPTGSGQFVARAYRSPDGTNTSRSCAANSTRSTRCWRVHRMPHGRRVRSLRCDCGRNGNRRARNQCGAPRWHHRVSRGNDAAASA